MLRLSEMRLNENNSKIMIVVVAVVVVVVVVVGVGQIIRLISNKTLAWNFSCWDVRHLW